MFLEKNVNFISKYKNYVIGLYICAIKVIVSIIAVGARIFPTINGHHIKR